MQQTNKPIKTEQEFKEALKQYEPKYELPMIMAFCNYWTETDQKGKMRFQAEKFFDISRRLATWARNQNSFYKNQNKSLTVDVPPATVRKVHESFTFKL